MGHKEHMKKLKKPKDISQKSWLEFYSCHIKHPQIYDAFRRGVKIWRDKKWQCRKIKKCSALGLIHAMRSPYSDIFLPEIKINNNWAPILSRLVRDQNKELGLEFEFRSLKI
jgi:hypothetical protein